MKNRSSMLQRIMRCGVLTLTLLAMLAIGAWAEDTVELYSYGSADNAGTKICVSETDAGDALFFPATASPSAFTLELSDGAAVMLLEGDTEFPVSGGSSVDLTALYGVQSSYSITVRIGEQTQQLTVYYSENLAAMYLTSDDPINCGREWVESSADKSNKATGTAVLQDAEGTVIYNGKLKQIKGRGNSTWTADKRPYQIKLDKSTDLLGSGTAKSKTWTLLANRYDASMLRNRVMFDLAQALNMPSVIEYRAVDLYYDGSYRGSYLLTEKVAISSSVIDINDLEAENEDANPDVEDYTALEPAQAVTDNGATYQYYPGLTSPETVTGGYILEMDTPEKATPEASWLRTSRGQYVVVKSPEYATKEEMAYIAERFQALEDSIYNGGTNPDTGLKTSDYADMTSIAQYYLLNELSKNFDGFRSSAYWYQDTDGLMYAAPMWDYDLAFGYGTIQTYEKESQTDGWYLEGRKDFVWNLHRDAEFRQACSEVWPQLSGLISNVLLGDENAVSADGALRSLSWYAADEEASAAMDNALWGVYCRDSGCGGYTWSSNVEYLRNFIASRTAWMNQNIDAWCTAPTAFYDVLLDDQTHWYDTAVIRVSSLGWMNGYEDGYFRPDKTLTRAQLVQTLYNMAGRPATEQAVEFTDVSQDLWYYPALCWAVKNGIIQGYPDGTFHGDATVSRQEAVVMLCRYYGGKPGDADLLAGYTDGNTVGNFAKAAVEWALENDILHGFGDQTIRPRNGITRAQLATLLANYNRDAG